MKAAISPKITKDTFDFDLAQNCDLKNIVGTFGLKTKILFSFSILVEDGHFLTKMYEVL